MPKVLEQRRQGLELYIRVRCQLVLDFGLWFIFFWGADHPPSGARQGVLYHNKELPQDVLDFLKVQHCQQDPKASSPP